jgi:hypothetical protein
MTIELRDETVVAKIPKRGSAGVTVQGFGNLDHLDRL